MTPRRSRGRRLVLVAVAALALVLAACSEVKNNGQNSLEPKGPQAQKIYDLFVPILIIAIVVGIAIIVATVFLAVRFRYKKGTNENPKQVHGNTRLEIGWTVIPALLLAIIAVPTVATIFDLAENPGPSALQVTVEGKQWWWQFSYPDAKVVTADEMVIPTGRDVFVKLTACDPKTGPTVTCNVIHSFWVPELAGKKDVVPGQTNTLTLNADKPGTYLGQCAEYCGLAHADMRMRVVAQEPADYQAWVKSQQAQSTKEAALEAGVNNATYGCASCHSFKAGTPGAVAPNLTHLADRTAFAGDKYLMNFDNLWKWIYDAPSRKPMGKLIQHMPNFSAANMTQAEAKKIACFLLENTATTPSSPPECAGQ